MLCWRRVLTLQWGKKSIRTIWLLSIVSVLKQRKQRCNIPLRHGMLGRWQPKPDFHYNYFSTGGVLLVPHSAPQQPPIGACSRSLRTASWVKLTEQTMVIMPQVLHCWHSKPFNKDIKTEEEQQRRRVCPGKPACHVFFPVCQQQAWRDQNSRAQRDTPRRPSLPSARRPGRLTSERFQCHVWMIHHPMQPPAR